MTWLAVSKLTKYYSFMKEKLTICTRISRKIVIFKRYKTCSPRLHSLVKTLEKFVRILEHVKTTFTDLLSLKKAQTIFMSSKMFLNGEIISSHLLESKATKYYLFISLGNLSSKHHHFFFFSLDFLKEEGFTSSCWNDSLTEFEISQQDKNMLMDRMRKNIYFT